MLQRQKGIVVSDYISIVGFVVIPLIIFNANSGHLSTGRDKVVGKFQTSLARGVLININN